jgi:hypothetical protein
LGCCVLVEHKNATAAWLFEYLNTYVDLAIKKLIGIPWLRILKTVLTFPDWENQQISFLYNSKNQSILQAINKAADKVGTAL